ncbi:hypothetical protein T01_2919 [Trichinella spiralis]|uniref:Uncharacterized protein n=1 Tax=Trichinella spiralis TaxID=6334 RepID=A0A0V1BCX1_TRISP|nr:hypothetical protein T01_2919 [Trichinella spiralis]
MFIVNNCSINSTLLTIHISHLFLSGDDKNNIRFALNFLERNKQNSFINQKTLAKICHIRINIKKKEKEQSDMTKVNGKASEVGLLGLFIEEFSPNTRNSYCDVEKENNATDHVDRYTEISNEL